MAHELSPRPELRHPVLADGRRAGRVDRPAGRLLPAVHVLGRRPPVAGATNDSGGGGLQIVVFVVAIVLAILAPILARLVQLAISRQREYLADASGVELTRNPVGPRAGAGEDRARPGAARGRQPGDPAPLLREPDQGRVGQAVEPVLDPPAGDGPDQPAAGAPGAARRSRTPISSSAWRPPTPTGSPNPSGPARAAARTLPADPVAMAVGARPRTLRRACLALSLVRGAMVFCAPPTGPLRGTRDRAEIAQLVEHATENRGVASSNLALGTIQAGRPYRAEVAQLVEHHLAKVRVAGSSPVFRSISPPHRDRLPGTAAPSSSGRTADFGSVSRGSNPRGAANQTSSPATRRRTRRRGEEA